MMQIHHLMDVLKTQPGSENNFPFYVQSVNQPERRTGGQVHSWGGVKQWVATTGGFRNLHGCVLHVFVSLCAREAQAAVVIAQEEPCAQRTLKLIKGRDRVIIHHGPLERLTLKSLLLINSEWFCGLIMILGRGWIDGV